MNDHPRGYKCKCTPCRYWQAEQRRRGRDHPELRRRYVDARPAIEHLRRLAASDPEIAYHAGLPRKTVQSIRSGLRPVIDERNAIAILLVRYDELTHEPFQAAADEIPEVRPTLRLLEGLAAQGWTTGRIAARAGVPAHALHSLKHPQRRHMKRAIAEAVARVADEIGDAEGTEPRNRIRAARLGWLPLKWGDDEAIAEQCAIYRCSPARLPIVAAQEADQVGQQRRTAEIVRERRRRVMELTRAGLNARAIGIRLGVSRAVVNADRTRYRDNIAA